MIPFNQEKSSLYFEFAMSSPDEPYTITFIAQTYNEKDKSITIEELQSESKTQHGKTEYHISINSNVLFVFINSIETSYCIIIHYPMPLKAVFN